MAKVIEVSESTYQRLENLAVGFDSPESVICRLLDSVEGKPESKPSVVFNPEDEDEFKRLLIERKEAEVLLFKLDGTREVLHWRASRFSPTSSLRGNLWSGVLRDWKKKGIKRAEFSIMPLQTIMDDDNTNQVKALALEFGLAFSEMQRLDYEIDTNESSDGLIYDYIVCFREDNDPELMAMIKGLDDMRSVRVDSSVLNDCGIQESTNEGW
ncbi:MULTISPECIES: hypothetical protein [Aliagarivorans]|uniref:hypothetical protein n=1 Tax=Aliagarivorans TaxID=882379 RepID=UPI001B7F97B3|nr:MULTISPECIES: hypothetical protein [Aliagarivorans]